LPEEKLDLRLAFNEQVAKKGREGKLETKMSGKECRIGQLQKVSLSGCPYRQKVGKREAREKK